MAEKKKLELFKEGEMIDLSPLLSYLREHDLAPADKIAEVEDSALYDLAVLSEDAYVDGPAVVLPLEGYGEIAFPRNLQADIQGSLN